MYKKVLLMVCVCSLTAACQPNPVPRTGQPKASAGVEATLPQHLADPPETLNIPFQANPAVVMARRVGDTVYIPSRAYWRGKRATLYYLPAHNVYHHGERYQIRSARDVQKLVTVPIDKDGHWSAQWYAGNVVPNHRPFFMLVTTDAEDYGLVVVNTLN